MSTLSAPLKEKSAVLKTLDEEILVTYATGETEQEIEEAESIKSKIVDCLLRYIDAWSHGESRRNG